MTDILLITCGALILVAAAWWLRGKWDERQALAVPRLLEMAAEFVAEAARLNQANPTAIAAQAIAQATIAAKTDALRATVAKL